ncbi:unnamed protein product [Rotaria socialis]|uniref:Uncharacterized protein n=1 Tax=Rotaria socialis TaxID=392032 RepID=A0A818D2P6_9BILA|nr:unnamed protein product [Rotaria socialis]
MCRVKAASSNSPYSTFSCEALLSPMLFQATIMPDVPFEELDKYRTTLLLVEALTYKFSFTSTNKLWKEPIAAVVSPGLPTPVITATVIGCVLFLKNLTT